MIFDSVELAVKHFAEITADLDYEICATIKETSSKMFKFKLHNSGENAKKDTRHSCVFEHYEPIILHNHPDKFYPSWQDVEKIMKEKTILFGRAT